MLRLLVYRGVYTTRSYHTKQCFGHKRRPSLQSSHGLPSAESLEARVAQGNLWRLATAYQSLGHSVASLDPLGLTTPTSGETTPTWPAPLLPETYGLDPHDTVHTQDILFSFPASSATVTEAVDYLRDMYSGTISLDASAMTNEAEREWMVRHYESCRHSPLTLKQQHRIAELLLTSQAFDWFLGKRFGSVKRYSGEGAESMMVFFEWVFAGACGRGVRDVMVCMPHRGRLNLLTGLLGLPPEALFHKLQGNAEFPEGAPCTGDVVSHLVSSVSLPGPLHVSLLPNPSHLEAVNPVAMGKARGRDLSNKTGPYSPDLQTSEVLTVQVHGDASFAAQGIVLETFSLNAHPHFDLGGSIHLIVNNQLGFTTDAIYGRSWQQPSDVGRVIGAPIIHVNGDHPEEVARATNIALDYRREFGKDVILNMLCFRRWGHNELDNPSLTQPAMYRIIETRPTVPDTYASVLENAGVMTREERDEILTQCHAHLDKSLVKTHHPQQRHLKGVWSGMVDAPSNITRWDTGCPTDLLQFVGSKSVQYPETLSVHPRLASSHVEERLHRLTRGGGLDWATAEAMAIGTLLLQGFNVRLSGQDVGRGTFSHRHAMLVCQESESAYIPLNDLSPDQAAFLEVANSPLSEEAVLAYEYGVSIESPQHLVLWEAQFGDFFNGAQTIIDTFISSGESKWLLQCGLVMLLPHGFDGAGPDHSSSHVERFLQLCDSSEGSGDGDCVNMHVAHPTTPAQYFHLLRRQMVRNFRKPLIVQSPKTLLRLPAAVSSLSEMGPGTTFEPVLTDSTVLDPGKVHRLVFCSGKHYYTLDKHRAEAGLTDTAIIRLELLCPFPGGMLAQQLSKFPNAKEFVWSQEEPENMGPWSFIAPRFRRLLGVDLSLVSRRACPATAVGVAKTHADEAKQLLTHTFPSKS